MTTTTTPIAERVDIKPGGRVPSLRISFGVVLIGGAIVLLFLSSACVYLAVKSGLTSETRVSLLFATVAAGFIHAIVAGLLVWKSSATSTTGVRAATRSAAFLYLAYQATVVFFSLQALQ